MTKEELLSIGAVSKLKDVTVKGLRYYHKIGLLEPAYVNAETGYRYYSVDQLMYLDLIKIGQQHGLSIKEIKQLFENNQLSFLRSVLEQKRQDIYQEMADLNAKLNTIDHLERFIRHLKTLNRNNDFQVVHFDTRYLIKASTKGNEIL